MHKRIVLKLGTASLMSDGKMDPEVFKSIAKQISSVKGVEFVIVSSGAIQAGREALSGTGIESESLEKKDIAGVGSRYLLSHWGSAFLEHGTDVSQIWITYANWENEEEKESVVSAIESYLVAGIVPILNENDVVTQSEISMMEAGISENDRLARMIAFVIKADAVLFLTSVEGVLDNNGEVISNLSGQEVLDLSSVSDKGRGGMQAKIREGTVCRRGGISRVAIAKLREDTISRFVSGYSVGTDIF